MTGNDITFNSTVDGTTAGVESLVANSNATGTTTFGQAAADGSDDNVGGVTQLAFLTTNADGTTVINSATVNTTGNQTYNDNVTVQTSGTGNTTTTLNSTVLGNIQIGSALTQALMGTPGLIDQLIANAQGGNVDIVSAVSNLYQINGYASGSFIGGNPGNTGINLYISQPIAPLVFLFNSPPAQYRAGYHLIDAGVLLAKDVQNLISYRPVEHSASVLDVSAIGSESVEKRTGAIEGDRIMSSFDLLEDEEEEE